MISARRHGLLLGYMRPVFLVTLLWTVCVWGNVASGSSGDGSITSDAEMILIPEGPFRIGSDQEDIDWIVRKFRSESREWYQDETPAQEIFLKSYYIDKFEVTNSQYETYIKATGKLAPKYWGDPKFNSARKPVVGVSFQEASDYCQWTGKRLPNEAEWEKAARGEDARKFPWGNEADPTRANVFGTKDQNRYTSSVGAYPQGKSPYGVMDMAGNVWEWTSGWYFPYPDNHYKSEMFGETLKVMRGGSWNSNMDLARTAIRGKALPDQRQSYIGFRCIKRS